uniref:Peptidase M10 metallopeptidase domain-containing protein n=1 Tax=Acrobeloides nanus TaxID=290746 RepID=A0A914DWG5_9BILA
MFREAFQKAFDTWGEVAPLEFWLAPDNTKTADFKIEFVRGDHDDCEAFDGARSFFNWLGHSNTLAHAKFPPSGQIHFDDDERWTYMNTERMTNSIATSEDVSYILETEKSESKYTQFLYKIIYDRVIGKIAINLKNPKKLFEIAFLKNGHLGLIDTEKKLYMFEKGAHNKFNLLTEYPKQLPMIDFSFKSAIIIGNDTYFLGDHAFVNYNEDLNIKYPSKKIGDRFKNLPNNVLFMGGYGVILCEESIARIKKF